MKIATVCSGLNAGGGVSTYLGAIMPALERHGHEVALWEECGLDSAVTVSAPRRLSGTVRDRGQYPQLEALRDWRPDVMYVHGLRDARLESRLLDLAPAVLFAHNYYGTCISGRKCVAFPVATPCSRRFDARCLLHYYPRRCGGLDPRTMWHSYKTQSMRRRLLSRYRAIVTNSDYLRNEYIRHGVLAERVVVCHLFGTGELMARTVSVSRRVWRLLFLGRMEFVKGLHLLLDSLPSIAAGLEVPVHLTAAGDGSQRRALEARAAAICHANPSVEVQFTGWLSADERAGVVGSSDLLVVPSIWPEPFGLVGLEAARAGVPAAAFDVGGMREWLTDGVNGHLAPGSPPSVEALVAAVTRCLRTEDAYRRLVEGARERERRLGMQQHLDALLPVLARAAGEYGRS